MFYLVFAVAFTAFQALGTWQGAYPGGRDFWEHLAAIAEVARHPLSPGNPHLALDQPTHLLTPYHWAWGCFFHLTRLDPFAGMALIAAANTAFWCVALRRFCARRLGAPDLALPLAALLLLGWWYPLRWSGFYHLGMQPLAAVYPATFALAASLWLIAGFSTAARPGLLAGRTLAMAAIFVSHPLTGSFLFLATAVQALCAADAPWRRRLLLAALPGMAVVLGLAWPLFPVLPSILGSTAFASVGFAGDATLFYQRPLEQIAPALAGLAWGAACLVRRRNEPLAWLALAVAAIYGFNAAFPRHALFARYLIFLALCGHLLLAHALSRLSRGRARATAAVAVMLAVGWFGKHLARWSLELLAPTRERAVVPPPAPFSNAGIARSLRAALAPVPPGQVVFAPLDESWYLPGLTGVKIVGIQHSNPFLADYFRRLEDAESVFGPAAAPDAARWLALAEKHRVDFVLIPAAHDRLRDTLPASFVAMPAAAGYGLWRVPRPAAP